MIQTCKTKQHRRTPQHVYDVGRWLVDEMYRTHKTWQTWWWKLDLSQKLWSGGHESRHGCLWLSNLLITSDFKGKYTTVGHGFADGVALDYFIIVHWQVPGACKWGNEARTTGMLGFASLCVPKWDCNPTTGWTHGHKRVVGRSHGPLALFYLKCSPVNQHSVEESSPEFTEGNCRKSFFTFLLCVQYIYIIFYFNMLQGKGQTVGMSRTNDIMMILPWVERITNWERGI